MKITKTFPRLLLVFSLFAVFCLSSCSKEEGCTNPLADNFNAEAEEDDRSCILAREKFIGQYDVAETCPSGNFSYAINIVTSSASENGVIINNFGEFGQPVNGTISGSNITIPSQNISVQGVAITLDGSGSITGNLLTINYTFNVSGAGQTCTKNCTKQ